MLKLGARIINYRQQQGFTQDELGEKLGVSAQAISKWERGLSLPDTSILPDIARILKITVDTLLETTATPAVPNGTADSPESGIWRGDYEPLMARLCAFDQINIFIGMDLFRFDGIQNAMEELMTGMPVLRRYVFTRWGIVLPIIRIKDREYPPLGDGAEILLRQKCVWRGTFDTTKDYGADRIFWEEEIARVITLKQEEKPPISWTEGYKPPAENPAITGQPVADWMHHVLRALLSAVSERLTWFNTLDHTANLLEAAHVHYPVLADTVVPGLFSLTELRAVYNALLAKAVPIGNQLTVLEALLDYKTANPGGGTEEAAAYVEERLGDCI